MNSILALAGTALTGAALAGTGRLAIAPFLTRTAGSHRARLSLRFNRYSHVVAGHLEREVRFRSRVFSVDACNSCRRERKAGISRHKSNRHIDIVVSFCLGFRNFALQFATTFYLDLVYTNLIGCLYSHIRVRHLELVRGTILHQIDRGSIMLLDRDGI